MIRSIRGRGSRFIFRNAFVRKGFRSFEVLGILKSISAISIIFKISSAMPGGRHYYAVGQNFAASQSGDSYKVNNYLMRTPLVNFSG